MKTKTQERDAFVSMLTEEVGSDAPELAEKLIRWGRQLCRIQERQCNGHQTWDGRWDEEAAKRDEKREEGIQARVTKALAPYGITPNFSGDPRGYTLKLILPSGKWNTWGGEEEGYGVPQS